MALAACDENEERFAHLGQLLRVSAHLIWLSQGSEEQAAASLILPRVDTSAAANFCLLQKAGEGQIADDSSRDGKRLTKRHVEMTAVALGVTQCSLQRFVASGVGSALAKGNTSPWNIFPAMHVFLASSLRKPRMPFLP